MIQLVQTKAASPLGVVPGIGSKMSGDAAVFARLLTGPEGGVGGIPVGEIGAERLPPVLPGRQAGAVIGNVLPSEGETAGELFPEEPDREAGLTIPVIDPQSALPLLVAVSPTETMAATPVVGESAQPVVDAPAVQSEHIIVAVGPERPPLTEVRPAVELPQSAGIPAPAVVSPLRAEAAPRPEMSAGREVRIALPAAVPSVGLGLAATGSVSSEVAPPPLERPTPVLPSLTVQPPMVGRVLSISLPEASPSAAPVLSSIQALLAPEGPAKANGPRAGRVEVQQDRQGGNSFVERPAPTVAMRLEARPEAVSPMVANPARIPDGAPFAADARNVWPPARFVPVDTGSASTEMAAVRRVTVAPIPIVPAGVATQPAVMADLLPFAPMERAKIAPGDAPDFAAIVAAPAPLSTASPSIPPAADQPLLDTAQADWIEGMIEQIEILRDAGGDAGGVTRIRLAPDALGSVEIMVAGAGDALDVRIHAESQAARLLLAEAAPRLVDMAEARGLRLGQSMVDAGGQGQPQSGREPPREQAAANRRASPGAEPDHQSHERIA